MGKEGERERGAGKVGKGEGGERLCYYLPSKFPQRYGIYRMVLQGRIYELVLSY